MSSRRPDVLKNRAVYLAEILKLVEISGNPLAAHPKRQFTPDNPHGMALERLELAPASAVDPVDRAPHEHPSSVSNWCKDGRSVVIPAKP